MHNQNKLASLIQPDLDTNSKMSVKFFPIIFFNQIIFPSLLCVPLHVFIQQIYWIGPNWSFWVGPADLFMLSRADLSHFFFSFFNFFFLTFCTNGLDTKSFSKVVNLFRWMTPKFDHFIIEIFLSLVINKQV